MKILFDKCNEMSDPGMPTKFLARLGTSGWNDNQVGTLECLGLVDKDTITNLTRSFQEKEVIVLYNSAMFLFPIIMFLKGFAELHRK